MTKGQAGIAVIAVALLAGSAGVGYHLCQPVPGPMPMRQIVPGSPRSVVYTLLKGMRDGDSELIRQAVHARDAHEAEAVDAVVAYSAAAHRLADVCDRAFGAGRVRLPLLPLSTTALEEQVAELNEVVDNELAEVDFNPSTNPSVFHLRRTGGRWTVMVRETFDPWRAEETGPLSVMIETLHQQAQSYTAVSDDIESGKLTASAEAQLALHRRMAETQRQSWSGIGISRWSAGEPGPWAR